MKFYLRTLLLIAVTSTLLVSCQSNKNSRTPGLAPNAHQVVAEEVIQTSMYTYVRVTDEAKEYWLAINKAEIKVGNTYYWSQGGEMIDFKSKELNKTFPSVWFIQDFTDQPILVTPQKPATSMAGKQQAPQMEGLNIPKVEGGVTIGELFLDPKSFEGKTIKIKGQVVKFSKEIMKKNWVHLQDGTCCDEKYDLTITTQEVVKEGDIVVFEGVIAVDKDFGYGYKYDMILEDALLKK